MTPQAKPPLLRRLLQVTALAAALPLATGISQAGTISTPSLDPVYGAANFGSAPIAIHWLTPGASVIDASLTVISNFDALQSLAFFHSPDASPVIDAFFVDQINWCNGASGSHFKGCSILNSNVLAVESSFAAGAGGYLDIAHELGHTLGLEHVSGTNLMNPVLGSATLTSTQITSILGNSKVQTASDGSRFIEIRPIAVLSAVPEPSRWALMALGVAGLALLKRRRA